MEENGAGFVGSRKHISCQSNCIRRGGRGNMKKLFFLIIVFSLIVFCGPQKPGWRGTIEKVNGVTVVKNPKEGIWDLKENRDVTISQELKIGQLDGPEEFLFADIADVAVNCKGDIYVADSRLNEIRKFDKEGNYLLTIGREGQGPGEFQSVSTITICGGDDLIAFDGRLGRLSVFSANGELKKTIQQSRTDLSIAPSRIWVTNEGYVFFGKPADSLKLFHEFDQEWNLKESTIDYAFIDNREFEELSLLFHPGYGFFQENGNILYTKYYDDHQIFVYKNRKLEKIIKREADITKPYEILVFHDVNKAINLQSDPNYQDYDIKLFGRGIAFFGKCFQNALGLFSLSDGHIVKFISARKSKDLREFGVELYDSEGRFLKYAKLGENLSYDIRRRDSNDLFYAIDREEYPKVIVFRLGY